MDDIAAELRSDNREVSDWLIFYRERKAENETKRDGIINSSPAPQADRVQGNKTSDPTHDRAVRLIQQTGGPTDWIWCVDTTRGMLGIKKKILLDLVQEAATKPIAGCTRRWWLPWVQVQLIERYGIDWDYGYINNNWNWIVELCLKVAYKKKLL